MKSVCLCLVACVATSAIAQHHIGISQDLGLRDSGVIDVVDECFELTSSGKPDESLAKLEVFNRSHSVSGKEEQAALLLMKADALLVKSKNAETPEIKRILESLQSAYRDSRAMAMMRKTKKLHELIDGGPQSIKALAGAKTATEAAGLLKTFLQANLSKVAAPNVFAMTRAFLEKWGDSPDALDTTMDVLNVLQGCESETLAYEIAKLAAKKPLFMASSRFLLKHANLSCLGRKFVDASWSLNLLDKMKLSDSEYAEYALFRAIYTRDQGNQKVALDWIALAKRFAEKSNHELITQQVEALTRPGASLDANPEGVEIPETSNVRVFAALGGVSVFGVLGYHFYTSRRLRKKHQRVN